MATGDAVTSIFYSDYKSLMTKKPKLTSASAVFYDQPDHGGEAKGPPSEIQIFPKPGHVKALDGREFLFGNYDRLIQDFKARGKHLPIDINHEMEPGLYHSPAYGWVTDLYIQDEALFATVEWTGEAEWLILSKRYKYYSPAWLISPETDLPVRLTSVALVNSPALDVPALAKAEPRPPHLQQKGPQMDDKETLAAIKARFNIDNSTSNDDLLQALAKAQDDKKPSVHLDAVHLDAVPIADHKLALARAEKAEAELKAEKDGQALAKAEALIDEATEAGKIAPVSRDFWLNTCKAQGLGPVQAHFESLGALDVKTDLPAEKAENLNPAQAVADKKVAEMLGLQPA